MILRKNQIEANEYLMIMILKVAYIIMLWFLKSLIALTLLLDFNKKYPE